MKKVRHSGEGGNPGRKLVFKEMFKDWMPAAAGMTTRFFIILAMILYGFSPQPAHAADIHINSSGSSAGMLRLSSDGKYIIDKNNQPFFMVGDAAWSLIAQLNNADTVTYLSDRSSRGFNTILTNLLEHQFASRAPANINGDLPFVGTAFQSAENEAYFAHADYVIQQAQNYGLTVLLFPAYAGYQGGSEGWCAEMQAATDQEMYAWGQYVGSRYKDFDNIIWVIGADANPAAYPNLQNRLNQVALGLSSADTNHRLMTAHNARGNSAMDSWSGYSWLTLNAVYETNTNMAGASASNYTRAGALPLFALEDYYENEHSMTALQLRQEAYGEVLNGCTLGRVFGNNPIWGFSYLSSSWSSSLGSNGSVSQSWLGKLMQSREFWLMAPDLGHTVVTAGYGSGTNLAVTSRSSDGQTIISYIPNGSSATLTVAMSKIADFNSQAKAWWFNPQTGAATLIGTFANSGSRNFTPPDQNDRVLVIDSAAANLPAPGSASDNSTPPSITAQPSNVTVNPGQSATFTISASGTAPLTYQWQKNSTNISVATSTTYTIASVASGDAGSYRCVVTNTAGSATSNAATLTVNPGNPSPTPPPPPSPPNPPGPSPISPIASNVGPERNVIHPSIGSEAVISFTCDSPAHVEINIFSRQGRVKGPIQGECVAGTNSFSWDGRNEDGRKVASGIYLVKIKVGDKLLTKKVAVVR